VKEATIPEILERAASRVENEAGLFSELLPSLAVRLIYEEAGGLLNNPRGDRLSYEAAAYAAKEFARETAFRLRQAAEAWKHEDR
jgi:hypothetical protein